MLHIFNIRYSKKDLQIIAFSLLSQLSLKPELYKAATVCSMCVCVRETDLFSCVSAAAAAAWAKEAAECLLTFRLTELLATKAEGKKRLLRMHLLPEHKVPHS